MIWLILLFVVILNAICIYLMYRFLKDTKGKEKFIFIAAGVAAMYLLTVFVHWISTHGLDEIYRTGTAKDLVIFLFVPINGLIVLPAFANSYYSYKQNKLGLNILAKRMSVLLIPLLIVLVIECIFLKDIQVVVTDNTIKNNMSNYEQNVNANSLNNTIDNTTDTENVLSNEMINTIANEISNSINDEKMNNNINDNEVNEYKNNENEINVDSRSNTLESDNNTVDDEK